MFKHQRNFLLSFIITALLFASCKKDSKEFISNTTPTAAPSASEAGTAQLNQTAFIKSQDFYLWNTQLPGSFNGASYGDPAAVMTSIRQYSNEPGFSGPVDRWSFAMRKTEWDQLSGGMSSVSAATSSAGDFGISVFFSAEGDLRVRLTEPNSPGGAAGIRRGWRVVKINGN